MMRDYYTSDRFFLDPIPRWFWFLEPCNNTVFTPRGWLVSIFIWSNQRIHRDLILERNASHYASFNLSLHYFPPKRPILMHSGCVLSSLPTNRFACDNPYHHTFTRRNRRQRTRMMMRCFPLREVPGIARLEVEHLVTPQSQANGDETLPQGDVLQWGVWSSAQLTFGSRWWIRWKGMNMLNTKALSPWLSPSHPTTLPLPASLPTMSCLQCQSWEVHDPANSSLKTPFIHEAIGMRFFTWNIRLALSICQDLVARSSSCLEIPTTSLFILQYHEVMYIVFIYI